MSGGVIFFIVMLCYATIVDQSQDVGHSQIADMEPNGDIVIEPILSPSIWVSMSLCWAENAQIYGKKNFPYGSAAKLSSKLWLNISDGEVRVALTIVHNDQEYGSDLREYKHNLEKEGVIVTLEKAGPIGCVLHSQMSRMFLFTNPAVAVDDIILVSDVDIFIMDKRILNPLRKHFQTWIYR